MSLNIIGIDASLSSTGITVAKCSFLEEEKDFLFKLLTQPKGKEFSRLQKSFIVKYAIEIKEDNETKKQLAKVRKQIRDNPTFSDMVLEEKLSTKKITDQVTQIIENLEISDDKNIIFIEDYSYHSAGSITQLAEMKGVLKTRIDNYMEQKDSNVIGYLTANINTVKKVGGRNGNANKELVCEEMQRFGFNYSIEEDDAADSTAISLASFYAIYNLLFPFEMPKTKNAKERNLYKSFIDSLNKFGERIGNEKDFKGVI
jgi:Holliday junction resolvasome RuvABC endonuclease subunit